jgi:nicotinamidase-related amidase
MALLVIDMLNDFFRRHARLAAQRSRLHPADTTIVKKR